MDGFTSTVLTLWTQCECFFLVRLQRAVLSTQVVQLLQEEIIRWPLPWERRWASWPSRASQASSSTGIAGGTSGHRISDEALSEHVPIRWNLSKMNCLTSSYVTCFIFLRVSEISSFEHTFSSAITRLSQVHTFIIMCDLTKFSR